MASWDERLSDSISTVTPAIDPSQILKAAATLGFVGTEAHSGPRMLAILSDSKVDVATIAAVIGGNPAMYARVLRVANSSYYRQSRSITSIERALVLLGRDAVRSIAAATCFDRTMLGDAKAKVINMADVARHSFATATAAEAMARLTRPSLPSDAFIGGLLHNLGVAVQVCLDSRGVEAMLEAARKRADFIRTLESDHSMIGHEKCLAVVFEAWQMPESLVAVAAHHHAPMSAPDAHRDLVALVSLGATLAITCGHGFGLESGPAESQHEAMQLLGVTEEHLESIAADLSTRVEQLESALLAA